MFFQSTRSLCPVVFRDLPVLSNVTFDKCMKNVGRVIFDNVPLAVCNDKVFNTVYEMTNSNAPGFEKSVLEDSVYFSKERRLLLSELSQRIEELNSSGISSVHVKKLVFSDYPNLRKILIASHSFPICEYVEIRGLSKLTLIKIGDYCFGRDFEFIEWEEREDENSDYSYDDESMEDSYDEDRLDERGMDEYDSEESSESESDFYDELNELHEEEVFWGEFLRRLMKMKMRLKMRLMLI